MGELTGLLEGAVDPPSLRTMLRRWAVYGLPLLAAMALTLTLLGRAELRELGERIELQQEQSLEAELGLSELILSQASSDVLYLARDPSLARWATNGHEIEAAAEVLFDFARMKPPYFQVRLLDAEGQEVVRYERASGELTRTPPERLEGKGSRPYVPATLTLGPGGLYLSPLDLNVEHGQVESPLRPTLRVASPIHDREGVARGLVILNYSGERLLKLLRRETGRHASEVWLLNDRGFWLLGPSPEVEWSFMLPGREASFARAHPEAWGRLQSQREGGLASAWLEGGVYSFARISPERVLAGASASEIRTAEGWFLVAHETPAQLRARTAAVFRRWLLAGLVAAALIVLGSYLAARLALRRDQAEARTRSRERHLRGLLLSAPDAILVVGAQGRIELFNTAAERQFGYLRDEVLGQQVEILVPEGARLGHPGLRRRYLDEQLQLPSPLRLEVQARRKDGSLYPASISLGTATSGSGPVVFVSVRDVSERARAESEILALTRDLRQANAELRGQQAQLSAQKSDVERASRQKSEFLANMSHELRTPLNAVIGFSELLLEEGRKTFSRRQLSNLEAIQRSGNHLLYLINDILDLSKIESGRLTLDPEPLDPRRALEAVLEFVRRPSEQRELSFETVVKTQRNVRADRHKLRQVLLNLVANAVKFSPAGGQIQLGVEDASPDMLRFWVRDEGPGIPAGLLPSLYDPFVQGEQPLQKKHEGTGLGLAISKRLVEQHGGTITCENGGQGGTTFSFTLPATDERLDTATDAPRHAPESPPPVTVERGDRRPVVLVADAHPASRQLLRTWLREASWTVVEATVAADTQTLGAALQPQAVVLDLSLARGEDGFDTLDALAHDPATHGIPVVVTSSRKEPELAARASDFFLKPLVRGPFMQRLTALLGPSATGSRVRGLLVTADADLAGRMRSLAESCGLWLEVARGLESGVVRLHQRETQVLLFDLPLDLARAAQQLDLLETSPETRTLPVLALVSESHEEALSKQLRTRADVTLSRDDVDADALIAAVRRALSRWSERTRRAPQVLIVDDHELNRRLLGALLERKGYRTLHAADGASALAQAREFAPALVLLDLAMPERDGFEVLSDLRRTPETQHIPVVALTALASREDRVRVEEAGFDGYLTKPIDRAALEALVARIVPDSDDA